MKEHNSSGDFEKCLDLIESDKLSERRRGTAMLENFCEPRALRVAMALACDYDDGVRKAAVRAIKALKQSGVSVICGLPLQLNRTIIETLASSVEIMDEAFFLWRRNNCRIALAWFAADLPKILGAIAVSTIPARHSGKVLCCFFLVILIFDPLLWMFTGRQILSAFYDSKTRILAAVPKSKTEYLELFKTNLLVKMPAIIVFTLVFFFTPFELSNIILLMTFAILFLLWWHSKAYIYMPIKFIDNLSDNFAALSLKSKGKAASLRVKAFMSFLGCMAMLYVSFVTSAFIVLDFFDVDCWESTRILGVFFFTNALLEQFKITWQILTASLIENTAQNELSG